MRFELITFLMNRCIKHKCQIIIFFDTYAFNCQSSIGKYGKCQNIKSLNTAKKHLQQLTELNILGPKKIGKDIVYLNIDLFNLLTNI